MVALLRESEAGRRTPRYAERCVAGLRLLDTELPKRLTPRRLRGLARRLRQEGVRRVLAGAGCPDRTVLTECGLPAVSALPLYRALAERLTLALLLEYPLRERRVALRGVRADGVAFALAERLCPRVGTLILDFEREDSALFAYLRRAFGAVALTPQNAPPPQVSVELAPREGGAGRRLKLWGSPEAEGTALWADVPYPAGVSAAEWLTLLWEAGRLSLSAVEVRLEKVGNPLTEA